MSSQNNSTALPSTERSQIPLDFQTAAPEVDNSLLRQYWELRCAVRHEEGRLRALSDVLLVIHNFAW